ncbi:hypothetical protein F6X68_04485 [Micromonospora sp. AMSO12t]|nr:hypothetical protein F6X68_04485 [Micromonospora sp. AMSO12t]
MSKAHSWSNEIPTCPQQADHFRAGKPFEPFFRVPVGCRCPVAARTEDKPRDPARSLDLTPSSAHLQADPPVGSAGLPACARSCSV